MKLITLYLPTKYIESLDQLVAEGFYPNRSEAIRLAVRDLIGDMNRFGIISNLKMPNLQIRAHGSSRIINRKGVRTHA